MVVTLGISIDILGAALPNEGKNGWYLITSTYCLTKAFACVSSPMKHPQLLIIVIM